MEGIKGEKSGSDDFFTFDTNKIVSKRCVMIFSFDTNKGSTISKTCAMSF